MNTLLKKKICLFALVASGICMQADAQRGGQRNGGGGNRSGSFDRGGQRGGGFSQSSGGRQSMGSFGRDMNTAPTRSFPQADSRSSRGSITERSGGSSVNSFPRTDNRVDRVVTNNSFTRRPADRTTTVTNVTVNNSINRVNNNYRGGYNYSRGYSPVRYNYAPRRYVYVGAPRYSILPHGSLTIQFGGYPYYYNSGLFYSYYDNFYQPVFAPIGIRISVLPVGYFPLYVGSRRYYYYDGVYYNNRGTNDYEVVDAPLGAQVSVLPKGATVATVNGEKFYEFNGTYYKEGVNSKNELIYTVTGKYGEVNNTTDQPATSLKRVLQVGDIVPVLPDGCKEVTIDGKQLYLSPENTYYKAVYNGNEVNYQIVGLGNAN